MSSDNITVPASVQASPHISLKDFLRQHLPEQGWYVAVKRIPKQPKEIMEHNWCESIDELARTCLAISAEGFDVYISTCAYQQKGELYSGRTQVNVRALKSFYFDIDAGVGKDGKEKPYKDAATATVALDAFCEKAGLPLPTVVISGHGIHAWWALDREIDPQIWMQSAKMLAVLAQKHGLHVDTSRTCDSASILRPVETINYKFPHAPAPVSCDELMDISSAGQFMALLRNACSAFISSVSSVNAAAMNIGKDYPPASAAKAVECCAQLRHMRDTKGNIGEPLWYANIGVLAHCTDGDKLAHEWSSGYPAYSPEETEKKITHARDAAGPTTCPRFQMLNPEGCNGCPHAGKIKSPIVLGYPDGTRNDCKEPSQRDRLIDIGMSADLWHDAEHATYATMKVADHQESHALRSVSFRRWLLAEYGEHYAVHLPNGSTRPSAPGAQAVTEALAALEAQAARGHEYSTAVRVAGSGGKVYVDLGNADWSVVEISAAGWQVIPISPVKFLRPRGLKPLPIPARGGNLKSLRQFLNLATDNDYILAEGWLVGCFSPDGPFPLLVLNGEQGACKSTASRVLRRLVDPNKAEIRSAPKDERDLLIAAKNGWVIALDNLSYINETLSDALCRIATSIGYATRSLFTDTDETIIEACRPILINGIPDLATRPDLADRSIVLTLPTLPDNRRQTEEKFWGEFNAAAPRILGAIFDGVACALQHKPGVKLSKMPRMADFAKWSVAAAPAMGWNADDFLTAYDDNRANAVATTLEADAVAVAVRDFIHNKKQWSGTAAALLAALNMESQLNRNLMTAIAGKGWPKTASHLSGRLRRVATIMRASGIAIEMGGREGKDSHKIIGIRKV